MTIVDELTWLEGAEGVSVSEWRDRLAQRGQICLSRRSTRRHLQKAEALGFLQSTPRVYRRLWYRP